MADLMTEQERKELAERCQDWMKGVPSSRISDNLINERMAWLAECALATVAQLQQENARLRQGLTEVATLDAVRQLRGDTPPTYEDAQCRARQFFPGAALVPSSSQAETPLYPMRIDPENPETWPPVGADVLFLHLNGKFQVSSRTSDEHWITPLLLSGQVGSGEDHPYHFTHWAPLPEWRTK